MRIEVLFTPHQVDEMYLREKTVVVIDVLRASTTVTAALYNGAKEIIPVATVESAMKIVGNLYGDVRLLGGERNGKMIEGFNLGNSPLEYTEERVFGKAIVYSTTNGSLAMVKARYAKVMVVASFVNLSAVAAFVEDVTGSRNEEASDITILCAGRNGFYSLEDSVCAGMLIEKLSARKPALTSECGDAGIVSLTMFKRHSRSLLKMLKNSEHGKYLSAIGYGDDLKFCAAVDSLPVVPQLLGNIVKLKKDGDSSKGSFS
jgi:2-phosphosulfolactate phosphatase